MNKKLIAIILALLIIFVSVDIYERYEYSLPNKVNISITPTDNQIDQGGNLTFFINATGSIRNYCLNGTSWISGTYLMYMGPNQNTHYSPDGIEEGHGLVKFNIQGNQNVISSWNTTIICPYNPLNNNILFYSVAPAGYYKVNYTSLSFAHGNVIPTIKYENSVIYVAGIYYNISMIGNAMNISLHSTPGYTINSNSSVHITSEYDNCTMFSYKNLTINKDRNYAVIHFRDLIKYSQTFILIHTQNGIFYVPMYYGGQIV